MRQIGPTEIVIIFFVLAMMLAMVAVFAWVAARAWAHGRRSVDLGERKKPRLDRSA